jgi:hypothetical protein
MEEDERSSIISRIGTFFILLGVLVVILFIASDLGKETYFGYFITGIILLVLGFGFKRMSTPAPTENQRFEALRRLQQARREARAIKEAAKKEARKRK